MADELTDSKLSKIRVGYKSDFLGGREAKDHEKRGHMLNIFAKKE